MKRALTFLGLLVPVMALALTFEDQTEKYTDAPFNSAITAGVSVLTEAGAIEGNPDGTFMPDRLLNRAEFLKIVLKSYPESTADPGKDAGNCFPDVGQWDWFSSYVCYAKQKGIVGGYPDGYFRPENSVNYAEALKILGELYNLTQETPPGEWYVQYREGAYGAGVGLPGLEQDMGHLLTRGEMARLAAAYLAHSQDQLEEYRAMERGDSGEPRLSAASSSSSSAAPTEGCCSSTSSSSSSFSSSSSSIAARWTHPTPSRFLVVGSRTMPIASGVFQFSTPMDIRSVTIEMKKKLRTIHELHLVDRNGRTLMTLKPDILDQLDKKWKGEAASNEVTVGPGSIPLGIEATMKTSLQGGFPEEFVEVKTMSIIMGEVGGIATSQALPVEWSHPGHQTVNALIDRVENAGPKEGVMNLGTNQRIGAFRFFGRSTGALLTVENLLFTLRIPAGVTVQNWRIARADGGVFSSCSFGSEGLHCPLSEDMGAIIGGALTIEVFGDVSMAQGTQGATLQILLNEPGSLSSFGAVQWTDGTGHYRWMEGEAPLAVGTGWEG
ncbi:MAG: S-layer protein [Candidatus Peregrinibacteria bacterium Greene0416_62]|nr:MAG: S-layer protein [Candidatus Peregrinibacteria bacterium Greene0416_62]TSC99375.1 MAG: S-layer protein [Candidatus Peregrinibacteria bacterium Greene1014_49]